MTRMEKYKSLREQIAKEIKENSKLWEQEQKIENYYQQLIKIDKSYFEPIFQKLNSDLNLVNFENYFIKNNEQHLDDNDKLILENMLENINNILKKYSENIDFEIVDVPLISTNLEYQTLINSMHNKINEFQKDLESKIHDVKNFVKNLEFKYKKYKINNSHLNKGLKEINQEHNNFQDELQKIKIKHNYKWSLTVFSIIIICLILIVVLVLSLILFIK
ncbi:hypothetical protein [Spiroplasma ixodetis]|uniref:hypothetical protein n=1 Tax=Spiroplasma ixodetis TaxID=2141 RepID=UPI002574B18E|nr:hypothetical protein [Spiroplasma ixodetis]WJG70394.1 hypothetical protein SIXOD_v1c15250 [Spiroplasma ixodetis Y32]